MITEELRKKIEQIKLRFVEITEQLHLSVDSGNAIVATQKTLLQMIEDANENVKESLADFVDATKAAMEKTENDLSKVDARIESAEKTEKFLADASEEELIVIYNLLVAAGLEQPVSKLYEDEPEEKPFEELSDEEIRPSFFEEENLKDTGVNEPSEDYYVSFDEVKDE